MYSIYANAGKLHYGVQKYLCDTEEDINSLPTNTTAGSMAFVIETETTYILTNNKKWVVSSAAAGGGGGGFWNDFGTGV